MCVVGLKVPTHLQPPGIPKISQRYQRSSLDSRWAMPSWRVRSAADPCACRWGEFHTENCESGSIYIYIFHLSILIYHSQIFYRLSQFESNLSISLIFCRWMAGRAAPCWRANLIEKEGLSPASQVRRMHLEDLNGWYLFGCFLT